MAFDSSNLHRIGGGGPGTQMYRYDSSDVSDVIEDAGYINNKDDDQNLGIGDVIFAFTWSSTPFAAGSTLSQVKAFTVTNVIANDAAASAGAVNLAEILISTAGAISSGD